MRQPELFVGAFVHSGIACGAASGPTAAIGVMRRGADASPAAIGAQARECAGGAVRLPLVVLHGDRDAVVAEINGRRVARQFLALNGVSGSAAAEDLPAPDAESTATSPSGRVVTTSEYRGAAGVVVRRVHVAGLDHAWSGGDPAYPYNDPEPPDATQLLGEFMGEVGG